MEAVSVEQTAVFAAAEKFARVEGILPAPESSHAIKVAIDEALKCKETGEAKNIFFGGEGLFNTVVTGPGEVVLQTMPVVKLAEAIIPYIPTGNSN